MIVVDTNVLAYLYLPGAHTAQAEALLESDPEWSVPILWRSEFRNVLSNYMRRGALTVRAAKDLQREAEDLLAGAEFESDSPAVLDLANSSGCSACDCEFVALAIKLETRLVTTDRQLLRTFPKHATPLIAS